jgi:hypothetical protein
MLQKVFSRTPIPPNVMKTYARMLASVVDVQSPPTGPRLEKLACKEIGHFLAWLSTMALCPGSTGVPPVPLTFQQMKGMIRELVHDLCLALS